MAVAARPLALARARRAVRAGARLGALNPLVALVGTAFVLRAALGWLRATPYFFPDEYIYSELGRSLAESGRPLVRGESADFPALLQPLLTAPAWLADDVETSFRLVQTMGALAMALAAVPVFLVARRLGLERRLALVPAALALAVPDLLYAGWLTAEAIAYPLALAAFAAGVAALAGPSARAQIAFAACAGLATFARVQFVVLPLCFLLALAVVGLRERRLRAAVREQALLLTLLALPLVGLLIAGPARALGYYRGVLGLDLDPLAVARWSGIDALLFTYASGWILVPGALLGLALAFRRPRSRTELSFAALAVALTGALLVEAAVYAASGGERVQERYFFYALPLVGIAFALYATRGWPSRIWHALLAGGLLTLSARLPLAGFSAGDGKANAPLLFAVAELEHAVGNVGLASLLVAGGVVLLSAAGVAVSFFPRRRTAIAVVLALTACLAASAGAAVFDHRKAADVRANVVGADPSWVDQAELGEVALLQAPLGGRGAAAEQLFWNRSLERVLLLPQASPPDVFAAERVRIGPDGTLLVGSRALAMPLLVDTFGAVTRFRGMREVARGKRHRLLAPAGRPRLSLYAPGRFQDGWLGLAGSFQLWPAEAGGKLTGTLSFTVSVPETADPLTLALRAPGGGASDVALAPGETRSVTIGVCSTVPWKARFGAPFTGSIGERLVSIRASEPVFRPDPAACAAES